MLEWIANHGCVHLTWSKHPTQKHFSEKRDDKERDVLTVILCGYLIAVYAGALTHSQKSTGQARSSNLCVLKGISGNIVKIDKNHLVRWIRCESLEDMSTFEDRVKKALIGDESVTLDEIYKGLCHLFVFKKEKVWCEQLS